MNLRELQLYKLNILKEVADICEKNGIAYMLFYGTLLGAIRHNGFIPWDDDIDIALTWNNYKKPLQVLKGDYAHRYFVQNIWTEKSFSALWTQLRVNGTTSMPVSYAALDIHWGICIDIFALISVSDDEHEYERHKKAIMLAKALLAKDYMAAKKEKAVGKQKWINMLPCGVRHLMVNAIVRKYAVESHDLEYVCPLQNPRKKFRYAEVKNLEKHEFEGCMLSIPKVYDAILTTEFGDYMTPPPPEKRGGHELDLGDTIIDANRDYQEYRREILGKKD